MAKPSRVRRSPAISGSASPSRSASSGSRSPPPGGKSSAGPARRGRFSPPPPLSKGASSPLKRATRIQESLVLHVDSLHRNVNESHLKEIFHNFGEVVHVKLAMDRAVNRPKRYAYVEFKTRTDAEKALLAMDGGQIEIDGKFVKAKFTLRPRQKVPPPPNSVSSAPKSDNTSADVQKAGPKRPERKERSYLQFIKIETKEFSFETPITTLCSSSLTWGFFDGPVDSKCFNVGALDHLFVRVGTRNKLMSNDNWSGDDTVCYFSFPADKNWLSRWSPRGSFFVACYYDMVIIWGSRYHQDHTSLMRFSHYQVEQFDLSPGEKYLVTYNTPKPSDSNGIWLKIFDVRTGTGIVGLNNAAVADSPQWPVIRWPGGEDDEYFVTLNKNKTASVYETKNLNLLGSPLLDLDDVIDISWSPTEPVLAILLKAGGKLKALLLRIPDKVKLAEKDLTAVVGDCKMHWQRNGEYLVVNTHRGFEFFRIKEGGIRADFLKVDKEILAFAWEPRGDRFAVIYGGDEQNLSAVSFYSMNKPGKVTKLTTLSNKQADALFWSPKGSLIVLAGLKAGKLEFYNVDRLVGISPVETVNANKVVWNPSGRYIATVSTIPEEDYFNRDCDDKQNDPLNGFNIWSSQGKLLCNHQFDSPLLQLDWRPHGRTSVDTLNAGITLTLKEIGCLMINIKSSANTVNTTTS